MATRYNHAYTLAFEITSNHPEGNDITEDQFAEAIRQRVDKCLAAGQLAQAVDSPFDTMEEEVPDESEQ